ncbi:unnamed protein product [Oppiella nova]|uniref:Nudix hydrolase domain-containing protein n=1 Tax=Oppiella nova TaxID=334625 RepID=A0A7R9MJR9_9ACAR|nr:unnamed protein product [Oppiella nova]CAG2178235.1 unnamed protein product [Oppiella nova]
MSFVSNISNTRSSPCPLLAPHCPVNGKPLIWDAIKIHDSVAVVVYNRTSKRLLFVRQFRPAVFFSYLCKSVDTIDLNVFSKDNIHNVNKQLVDNPNLGYTIELCAGILDKQGKSPQEVAKEEIEEEIGYKVELNTVKFISSYRSGVGHSGSLHTVKFISSYRSGVGHSGSLQYLYYCEITDETPKGKGGGIEDESIEVIELSIEEAKKLLYCEDLEAKLSRPTAMLFALCWFFYERLPQL